MIKLSACAVSVFLFIGFSALGIELGLREGKKTSGPTDWTLQVGKGLDYDWVKEDQKVPALSKKLIESIKQPDKVELVEDPAVEHCILKLPSRSVVQDGQRMGGVILLEPGKTAESLLSLQLEGDRPFRFTSGVSQLSLHSSGFFFTAVAGSSVVVASYIKEKGTVSITKASTADVRTGDVKVELLADKVMVDFRLTRTFYDQEGKQTEGQTQFYDLTPENVTSLKEDFQAVDLTQEAKLGRIDSHPFFGSYADQVLRHFSASGRSSVLLIDQKVGAEAEQVVYQLASALSGKETVFGESGWKLFEINWKVLGAEGYVDVTVGKVNKLFDIARQKKVILYIPAIENLKDLGVTKSGEKKDATAAMQRDIETGRVIVIGRTDAGGLNLLQGRATDFLGAFSQISVAPAEGEALATILKDYATKLERQYGIAFSDTTVDEIIRLTNQFIPEEKVAQPQKSMHLMLSVARNSQSYLKEGEILKTRENGKRLADERLVRRYLAEVTRITTIAEQNDEEGLRKFTVPENFYKEMDKRIVGLKPAKEAVLRQLLLVADDKPLETDGDGGELGVPVMLFLGPSGVGKSFIPEQLSQALKENGVEWPWLPVELSAASDQSSSATLTGSRPGYVGFMEEGSKFIQMLRDNPQAILVFEEIDKAHVSVLQTLYPFLERGRFQDAHLHNVRWTRGLVFLTSNFGAQGNEQERVQSSSVETSDLIDQYDNWKLNGIEPRESVIKTWSEEDLKRELISDLIDTGKISPQVIGRIGYDNVVILHHFSKEDVKELVHTFQGIVTKKFKENYQLNLSFTPAAEALLLEQAWGPEGRNAFDLGARAAKDLLTKQVYSKLQLFCRQPEMRSQNVKNRTIVIAAFNGKLEFSLAPKKEEE